jgi:GNAT superfamily N-acetyltransferase
MGDGGWQQQPGARPQPRLKSDRPSREGPGHEAGALAGLRSTQARCGSGRRNVTTDASMIEQRSRQDSWLLLQLGVKESPSGPLATTDTLSAQTADYLGRCDEDPECGGDGSVGARSAAAPILRRMGGVPRAAGRQSRCDRAATGLHRSGMGPRRGRCPGDAGGFSVVVPITRLLHELDGLFVDPSHMSSGIGRALVEDAAVRASNQGAEALEVTAGPAQSFYERVGFRLIGAAQTRFGPAVRMRWDLHR